MNLCCVVAFQLAFVEVVWNMNPYSFNTEEILPVSNWNDNVYAYEIPNSMFYSCDKQYRFSFIFFNIMHDIKIWNYNRIWTMHSIYEYTEHLL